MQVSNQEKVQKPTDACWSPLRPPQQRRFRADGHPIQNPSHWLLPHPRLGLLLWLLFWLLLSLHHLCLKDVQVLILSPLLTPSSPGELETSKSLYELTSPKGTPLKSLGLESMILL